MNPLPTPLAGAYYPIYNASVNQYITPTVSMSFDKVSTFFVAFAHAYPTDDGKGATLQLEHGQPLEPERLSLLVNVARRVNSNIKILITLGWGHPDWSYIGTDYTSVTNSFAPSIAHPCRQT